MIKHYWNNAYALMLYLNTRRIIDWKSEVKKMEKREMLKEELKHYERILDSLGWFDRDTRLKIIEKLEIYGSVV